MAARGPPPHRRRRARLPRRARPRPRRGPAAPGRDGTATRRGWTGCARPGRRFASCGTPRSRAARPHARALATLNALLDRGPRVELRPTLAGVEVAHRHPDDDPTGEALARAATPLVEAIADRRHGPLPHLCQRCLPLGLRGRLARAAGAAGATWRPAATARRSAASGRGIATTRPPRTRTAPGVTDARRARRRSLAHDGVPPPVPAVPAPGPRGVRAGTGRGRRPHLPHDAARQWQDRHGPGDRRGGWAGRRSSSGRPRRSSAQWLAEWAAFEPASSRRRLDGPRRPR